MKSIRCIIRNSTRNRKSLRLLDKLYKLFIKEREGARIRKKYDNAKTPYQRVLENEYVCEEVKERLRKEYDKLNPVELRREMIRLENKLFKMAVSKMKDEDREIRIESYVLQ
jgi:hypothetical protein